MLPFNKTIPAVVVAVAGFVSGAYVFAGLLAEPARTAVPHASAGDVAIKAEGRSPTTKTLKPSTDSQDDGSSSNDSSTRKPALGKLVNEQG